MSGGKVSIFGTMIGAGIMTLITTLLAVLKLDAFTHQIFIGGILLAAFMLNRARETWSRQHDTAIVESKEHAVLVEAEGDRS